MIQTDNIDLFNFLLSYFSNSCILHRFVHGASYYTVHCNHDLCMAKDKIKVSCLATFI